MKLSILFWMFIFSVPGVCSTVTTQQEAKSRWSTTADLTYASQYVTDGFRVGDGQPVMMPSLRLSTPSKEISFMYWTALQINREKKEYDEHDIFLFYKRDFLTGTKYAFNIHGFYDYWFYPNTKPEKDQFGDTISNVERHGSKVQVGASLTNLLESSRTFLIPTYNYNYWIYWEHDRRDQYRGGGRHEVALQLMRWFPRLISGLQQQYFGVTGSVSYHDGAFNVRPGLSHSTATLWSSFNALGATFTASLNQQWSYQRTVSATHNFWTTLSLTKEF